MGRPKKVIEEVITEEIKEEVKLQELENVKTVVMIRSDEYPMPREANVHVDEVENWSKHGWIKK